jgi:hypothetical protein
MKKDFTEALTNAVDNLARGHERTARIVYDRHVIDTGKRTVTIEFTPERKPTWANIKGMQDAAWGFMTGRTAETVTTNGIGETSWLDNGYWHITHSGVGALGIGRSIAPRFEPKPGEECWMVCGDAGFGVGNPSLTKGPYHIRRTKWSDDNAWCWLALKAAAVFRTRDEAKAELFKRQGEK